MSTWKMRPTNAMTSDEMKMPLCASTIGKARRSQDLLLSGSMLFFGGGYSGVTPIGTKGEVTSAPNADFRTLSPLLDAPFGDASGMVAVIAAAPRGTRRGRGS